MAKIKSIIVEGADQQGKSFIAKFLSERLDWNVVHYGMPPPDFDFYRDYILHDHTISDRNYLSEVVYSKIRKQKCRIMNHIAIEREMKNTLLILADRRNSFVFDNRDEEYNEKQIYEARELYRYEFRKLSMNKMLVNLSDRKSEQKLLKLIQHLRNEDYKRTGFRK